MSQTSFVYIMTNRGHRVLYTGVTGNLRNRVLQHKQGLTPGFARKYKTSKLVFYETFGDIRYAIEREKQIKAGSRTKKVELINSMNPLWRDLAEEWIK